MAESYYEFQALDALVDGGHTTAVLDYRGGVPVLDFADTTNKLAVFIVRIPSQWDGSASLLVDIEVSADTTGNMDWDAEVALITENQDIDVAFTYDTGVSTNGTAITSGGVSKKVTLTLASTDVDAATAGDRIALRLTNDVVSDSHSGDLELHGGQIRIA